jgi:hypothetical protein
VRDRERDPGVDVALVTLPVGEQHERAVCRQVLREVAS